MFLSLHYINFKQPPPNGDDVGDDHDFSSILDFTAMAEVLSQKTGVQLTEDTLKSVVGQSVVKNRSNLAGQEVIMLQRIGESSTLVSGLTENHNAMVASDIIQTTDEINKSPTDQHEPDATTTAATAAATASVERSTTDAPPTAASATSTNAAPTASAATSTNAAPTASDERSTTGAPTASVERSTTGAPTAASATSSTAAPTAASATSDLEQPATTDPAQESTTAAPARHHPAAVLPSAQSSPSSDRPDDGGRSAQPPEDNNKKRPRDQLDDPPAPAGDENNNIAAEETNTECATPETKVSATEVNIYICSSKHHDLDNWKVTISLYISCFVS